MKNISTIFSLILGVSVISAATIAQGQRSDDHRRRSETQRDHDDRDRNQDSNHDRDHWDNHNNNNSRRDHTQYDRVNNNRGHHYGQYNNRRPVVVHHVYKRPRYIYYRDYDVYYDCRDNAYISHSGRNWIVSSFPPRMMRNVNLRMARSYEVDYWDDNFPGYLDRRRPSIGREYRGW